MEFDTSLVERNAEVYGANLLACPHCGQPYSVTRKIEICIAPLNNISRDEDDWGNKIRRFITLPKQ
jgi:ribosomal protein S14